MYIQDYFSNIRKEEQRDKNTLHLTANEPYVSETAREFMSSRLADRYYFGSGDETGVVDFGPGTFRGMPAIQAIVDKAEKAARQMLYASVVNLSSLSGIHAMMLAILSTTEPGDTIMSLDLAHGGHFATKAVIKKTGRNHTATEYNFETLSFDIPKLSKKFGDSKAKVLYLDASYYITPHNLSEIRSALGNEAVIIYDASHTLGLIMGGHFQSPFLEGADVICANTHKTLPGPQKGLIAFRNKAFGDQANAIINAGLFSSPHTASMISLAVTILEMKEFGKAYARQIIANSNALGAALVARGYSVRKTPRGRYSDNHQIHLFSEEIGHYRELYAKLAANNITLTFDRPLGGAMFARVGTQEITRRGMKEAEMEQIAEYLDATFRGEVMPQKIQTFIAQFTSAHYSFDNLKSK